MKNYTPEQILLTRKFYNKFVKKYGYNNVEPGEIISELIEFKKENPNDYKRLFPSGGLIICMRNLGWLKKDNTKWRSANYAIPIDDIDVLAKMI